MITRRGTRKILRVDHVGPKAFVWQMACGHGLRVEQAPRMGQRTAVCNACRGGPAHPERSTQKWKRMEPSNAPLEQSEEEV